MSQFVLGAAGRLLLVGGKPLLITPGTAPLATPTVPTLSPWTLVAVSGATARFNVHTSASSNDTAGSVPFIFTYSGPAPTLVQAQVVDASSTVIKAWTDITSSVTTDANGTCLGYLNDVPAGIGYKRQIRTSVGGTVYTDTVPFNVGWGVLPWGQSNMVNGLTAGSGSQGGIGGSNGVPGTAYTEKSFYEANGTATYFSTQGMIPGGTNSLTVGSYNVVAGGGLQLMRLLSNALQTKFGRKVGLLVNPWAQNATPISGFVNAAGVSAMLSNNGTSTASGGNMGFSSPANYASGDYRIVAFHQGETPDTGETTVAGRTASLKRLCQAHINQVAKFGRPPSKLTFLFTFMGVFGTGVPQAELLRAAVLALMADADAIAQGWDIRIGWNCIDLDPTNGGDGNLHIGTADQVIFLKRMTQAFGNVIDPVNIPVGARGPYLTGVASRTGDVVTLNVARNGGTALKAKTAGSAITGWYANTATDFSGTDIALSNVTILAGTDQVQVTATGAPATFYIKHCGGLLGTAQGYHPDISNLIYNDLAYPTWAIAADQLTGLPLCPTPYAIKVG